MAEARPRRDRGARHTARVRAARVVLPVLALGLLSTVFLLARPVDPGDAIPLLGDDVSARALERQLTAPRVTGVTEDGVAYRLSAARAQPDAQDARRLRAEAMRVTLTDGTGSETVVTAEAGEVDTGRRTLRLTGGVAVDTGDGYALRTAELRGALDRLDLLAPGAVEGVGPLGTLRAGSMRVTEDGAGRQRLTFRDGVDLLYVPPPDPE